MLSAALDSGTVISVIFIFFALQVCVGVFFFTWVDFLMIFLFI